MNKLLSGVSVFTCAIACAFQAFGISATASCPAPASASQMTLTFDSEFAKTGILNTSQWHPYVGQHGTPAAELEVYTANNVKVTKAQGLRLITERQNYWEHQYTSGEVITQGLFSQTYGHFEMLAKMPQANGMWPAFWLLPENGGWPPEIDVVEYIYAPWGRLPSMTATGQGSNPQTTLHWPGPKGQNEQLTQGNMGFPYFQVSSKWDQTPAIPGMGGNFTGYHLYSIDWRPGEISYFIDNKAVFCVSDTAATGQRVPSIPMFMILNDAITSGTSSKPGWPGFVESTQAFPLYFDIAYVKAYQFKNLHPAHMPMDITGVRLSNPSPIPAQKNSIEATIHVGPNDLGSGGVHFDIYDFINPQQYQGEKSILGVVGTTLPSLKAGGVYHVSVPFTVPSVPGTYGITAGGNYSEGPTNGSGSRRIAIQQAQTFVVH